MRIQILFLGTKGLTLFYAASLRFSAHSRNWSNVRRLEKTSELHGTHLVPCSNMLTIKRSVFVPVLESMKVPMIYLLRFTHRAA